MRRESINVRKYEELVSTILGGYKINPNASKGIDYLIDNYFMLFNPNQKYWMMPQVVNDVVGAATVYLELNNEDLDKVIVESFPDNEIVQGLYKYGNEEDTVRALLNLKNVKNFLAYRAIFTSSCVANFDVKSISDDNAVPKFILAILWGDRYDEIIQATI